MKTAFHPTGSLLDAIVIHARVRVGPWQKLNVGALGGNMGMRRIMASLFVVVVAGTFARAEAGLRRDTVDLPRYLFKGTVAGKVVWANLKCAPRTEIDSASDTPVDGSYRYQAHPINGTLELKGMIDSNGLARLMERMVTDPLDGGETSGMIRETGRFTGRFDPGFKVFEGEWTSMDGKRREPFHWSRIARFRKMELAGTVPGRCAQDEDSTIRCSFTTEITFLEWDSARYNLFGELVSLPNLVNGSEGNSIEGPFLPYDSTAESSQFDYANVVDVGFLTEHLGFYTLESGFSADAAQHNNRTHGSFFRDPVKGIQKLTLDRVISSSPACRKSVRRHILDNFGTSMFDTRSTFEANSSFAIYADRIQIMNEARPACCYEWGDIPYSAIPGRCFEPLRRLIERKD